MTETEMMSAPGKDRRAPALRGLTAGTVPTSSWLFIRGEESIWIERPPGLSMIVVGPGPARAHIHFLDEKAVHAYQVATAERLTLAGWFLWGFDRDRRQSDDRHERTRRRILDNVEKS